MTHIVFGLVLYALLAKQGTASGQEAGASIGPVKYQGAFIALSVPDAEATAKWYEANLGVKEVSRGHSPDGMALSIGLQAPGLVVEIVQHKLAQPKEKLLPGIKGPHQIHGIFKAGVLVDRLDDLYAQMQAKKLTFVGGLFEDKRLALRCFIVKDNAGDLIQFFGK